MKAVASWPYCIIIITIRNCLILCDHITWNKNKAMLLNAFMRGLSAATV